MHTASDKALSPDDILSALDGSVEPIRRPPLYHLNELLVAVTMVILPLVYVAILVLLGMAIGWYATHAGEFLTRGSIYLIVFGYLGPLFIGCTVLLFMIKPIFAPPVPGPEPHVVDPESQPLLFAYVERLCELLRAPRPKQIRLDVNANASASFHRLEPGSRGFDLVLTIGLPLVQEMTLRQLTGVLAHELGHFSQGVGMRVSYLIRRINHWFARVVYERDELDMLLKRKTEEIDHGLTKLVLALSQGAVGLGRKVLWVLMWIGNVASCALLRQMEYDADRYEARVAGSAEHEGTARCVVLVGIAQQICLNDLDYWWQERRLPDDFPMYVSETVALANPEETERFWSKRLEEKTRWASTHPSDSDRIRSAMKENAPGIMTVDAPARALFESYAELSLRVSGEFYSASLGERMEGTRMVPTKQILADRERTARAVETMGRFFQNHDRHRLVFLGSPRLEPVASLSAVQAPLEEARRRILEPFPEDADEQRAVVRNRLTHGLQLLYTPEVQARAAAQEETLDLPGVDHRIEFLHSLELVFEKIVTLRERFGALNTELQVFERFANDPEYRERVEGMAQGCATALDEVATALEPIRYPYEHATENITCAQYAVPHPITAENRMELLPACQLCLQRVYELHYRVIGDLALAAEHAERLAGYPDLPAPPEEAPGESPEEMPEGAPRGLAAGDAEGSGRREEG